jgi:hypothetical protein
VQSGIFGRELPRVAVPADLSKRWILQSIEGHPERAAWREVPDGPGALARAADGALVLMAHLRFPAHIGVWLKPEARVIHCSEQHGVCCESVLALRQMGWKRLSFFEPISQAHTFQPRRSAERPLKHQKRHKSRYFRTNAMG